MGLWLGFGFGVGVVDGTGICVVDGVGTGVDGVDVGEAVTVTVGDGDVRCGAWNEVAGRSASARTMNSRHIFAGNDAPTTAIPRTSFMARNESA